MNTITDPIASLDNNILIQAELEGWGVFETDEGEIQIQRCDEKNIFPDDKAAWEFLISQALYGSITHQRAIKHIKDVSPDEYSRFVSDIQISASDETEFKTDKPFIGIFPNGAVKTFDSEDEACNYQTQYRTRLALEPATGE